MPIGFDPNDTTEITLDCIDKDKSADQRARFTCRHLTSREVKKVERLLRDALGAPSSEEADAKLNEAIKFGVVGWRGLRDHAGADVPFGDAAFEEMTPRLKIGIVQEYPLALLLSDGEKKA